MPGSGVDPVTGSASGLTRLPGCAGRGLAVSWRRRVGLHRAIPAEKMGVPRPRCGWSKLPVADVSPCVISAMSQHGAYARRSSHGLSRSPTLAQRSLFAPHCPGAIGQATASSVRTRHRYSASDLHGIQGHRMPRAVRTVTGAMGCLGATASSTAGCGDADAALAWTVVNALRQGTACGHGIQG